MTCLSHYSLGKARESDQFKFLGNCQPSPPLRHTFAVLVRSKCKCWLKEGGRWAVSQQPKLIQKIYVFGTFSSPEESVTWADKLWVYATGRQKKEDGKTLVCDILDMVITCVFCRDLHLHLCFLVFYKKICLKEGEVRRNVFSNKVLSALSRKVCRLSFSSPVRLRKLTINGHSTNNKSYPQDVSASKINNI